MTERDLEHLADLVADRVADRLERPARWLTVEEVAERFNLSTAYIYENKDRLGAIPLSDGPKARLRFDPERVVAALSPKPFETPQDQSAPPARRKPKRRPAEGLLPIKGAAR